MANTGIGSNFGVPAPARLYVNGVQVHASPWDMGLDFQLLTPVGTDDGGNAQVSVQFVARIVMSPQHAKAVSGILQTLIANWERQYGTLPDVANMPGVTVKEE